MREGDRVRWRGWPEPGPCETSHPDAGGECQGTATIEVYGLAFCELHGAEVKAGALAELYHEAASEAGRMDNPSVLPLNPEARRGIRAAVRELEAAEHEAEKPQTEALLAAYPLSELRRRADEDTLSFDYTDPNRGSTPEEWYWEARDLLHKLMRLAYEGYEDWLVEILEEHRESVSAQLAFAYADFEERRSKGELAGAR